jgi:HYR domain
MTCPVAISLSTAINTCSAVATYTNPLFTDNCAPTTGMATRVSGLVSGSTFPVGNSNVVFQATDAAGNTRRCTMVVTVTDNQPPVITCPVPVVVTGSGTPCKAVVFYGSTTASDNCAGTLTPFLVTGLASGSSFPVGITTNTFRAVAPNGQSSECSFSVTVDCGSGMGNTGSEDRDLDLIVQHSNNLDLKLAPNPALSTVTVSIEGVGAGGGTLLVYNAVGRLVLRQIIAADQRTAVFQLDGSEFAPGLYRVNLRTERGMVTKTLVVVK